MPPTMGGKRVPYERGQSGTASPDPVLVAMPPAKIRTNVAAAGTTASRCRPAFTLCDTSFVTPCRKACDVRHASTAGDFAAGAPHGGLGYNPPFRLATPARAAQTETPPRHDSGDLPRRPPAVQLRGAGRRAGARRGGHRSR